MIPYGRQSIDEADIREVTEVLKSDWITTGPKIQEFESAITGYIGCRHATVVNSGTSALDIAVQALNLPPCSEIITTPFTFVATSNAILYNKHIPVFADISADTRNLDPEDIRKRITPNTRALIFVDYAGHPCKIDEIKEIAEDHSLILIEDACHAIGAGYKGKKIGNLADMTVFSFHPVKHITTGEGGAVTTNNGEYHERLTRLRNHGIDRDAKARYGRDATWAYDMKDLGRNYRMTDFQAALGISQLKKLDTFIGKRRELAEQYCHILKDISWVTPPVTLPSVTHAWHIFTILLDRKIDRNAFFTYMRNHDIGVNVHYIPVYHHTYYKNTVRAPVEHCRVTEDVFERIVTLPLYPDLTFQQIEYVVETLNNYNC